MSFGEVVVLPLACDMEIAGLILPNALGLCIADLEGVWAVSFRGREHY